MKNKLKHLSITLSLMICIIFFSNINVNATQLHLKNDDNNSSWKLTIKTIANYDADSTFMKFQTGTTSQIAIVDLGDDNSVTNLKNLMGTRKTIDYLILTHWHKDHCAGLKLSQFYKNFKIKNLFISGVNFTPNYIKPLLNNKCVDNIYCFGTYGKGANCSSARKYFGSESSPKVSSSNKNSLIKYCIKGKNITVNYIDNIKTINKYSTYQIKIIPTLLGNSSSNSTDENNRSLSVIVNSLSATQKFKVIFPGDNQADGLKSILNNSNILNEFESDKPDTTNVIYKASHHGKARWHDFLRPVNTESEYSININNIYAQLIENDKDLINYNNKMLLFDMASFSHKYYNNFNKNNIFKFSAIYIAEKKFINKIKPDTIVGTNWPKNNGEKDELIRKKNYNFYKRFIDLTSIRNKVSLINNF